MAKVGWTVFNLFVAYFAMLSSGEVLNTLKSLQFWAKEEFGLYTFAKGLLAGNTFCEVNFDKEKLQIEKSLVNFIEDYESSIVVHLQGVQQGVIPTTLNSEYAKVIASSLILVYRMTHRFAKYGDMLRNLVTDSPGNTCNGTLAREKWPGTPEYNSTMLGLLENYRITALWKDPEQFLADLSRDSRTPAKFTVEMAFDLSQYALEIPDYVQAMAWIDYALSLWKRRKFGLNISQASLEQARNIIINRHNIDWPTSEDYDEEYFDALLPQEINLMNRQLSWKRRSDAWYEYQWYEDPFHDFTVDTTMKVLCSRGNLQTPLKRQGLRCFQDKSKHPWLTINPLRVEQLSKTPEILLFHDIIGNSLASQIIDSMSTSQPTESGIIINASVSTQGAPQQRVRSSVNYWFDNDKFPKLTRISSIVTGLQATGNETGESEDFQAVEYVVGRYYMMHMDEVSTGQIRTNRVATLLYYLNDVEAGGATAFGSAGIAVPPKKGSAVFWNNVHKNGTVREDVWHASCPVLYGSKYVVNKWFLSTVQFRTFPCSLKQDE